MSETIEHSTGFRTSQEVSSALHEFNVEFEIAPLPVIPERPKWFDDAIAGLSSISVPLARHAAALRPLVSQCNDQALLLQATNGVQQALEALGEGKANTVYEKVGTAEWMRTVFFGVLGAVVTSANPTPADREILREIGVPEKSDMQLEQAATKLGEVRALFESGQPRRAA